MFVDARILFRILSNSSRVINQSVNLKETENDFRKNRKHAFCPRTFYSRVGSGCAPFCPYAPPTTPAVTANQTLTGRGRVRAQSCVAGGCRRRRMTKSTTTRNWRARTTAVSSSTLRRPTRRGGSRTTGLQCKGSSSTGACRRTR